MKSILVDQSGDEPAAELADVVPVVAFSEAVVEPAAELM